LVTDAQVSRASADLLPSEHIQDDIVRIALDKVEGIPFEQYAGASRRRTPLMRRSGCGC